MPQLNRELHPVLLPLGWPSTANEREAFSRVLLAAGADVARMIDPIAGSTSGFLRHAARMPFLRRGRECPLVALAPETAAPEEVLDARADLLEALPNLCSARWLVFLVRPIRARFLGVAERSGGLLDAGGGLHGWDVAHGPMAIVSGDTWLAGLYQRLDALLNGCSDSGVIPAESSGPRSQQAHRVPTTAPAPPDDAAYGFESQSPYAALANRNLSPVPRDYLTGSPPPPPSVATRTLSGIAPELARQSPPREMDLTNQSTNVGAADFARLSPPPFASPSKPPSDAGPRPVPSVPPSPPPAAPNRRSTASPREFVTEPRCPTSVPPNPRLRNR